MARRRCRGLVGTRAKGGCSGKIRPKRLCAPKVLCDNLPLLPLPMTMMGMPTSFPTVSRSFSGNVQPNGDKDNISAEFQAFTERLNRRVQTSLQHNAFKPKPLQHYPGTAGISAQIVARESACASSLHIRSRKSVKRTKQDLSASMERLASPGLQIRPATSDDGSDQGASPQLFSPIRSQKGKGRLASSLGCRLPASTPQRTTRTTSQRPRRPLIRIALTSLQVWACACVPQVKVMGALYSYSSY